MLCSHGLPCRPENKANSPSFHACRVTPSCLARACQHPVTLAYTVTVPYSPHAQTSSENHVRTLPCTITSAGSTPPCRSQPLHVPSINLIHLHGRTSPVTAPTSSSQPSLVPQLSAPHQPREGLSRMPAKLAIKAHGPEGKGVGYSCSLKKKRRGEVISKKKRKEDSEQKIQKGKRKAKNEGTVY